MGGRLWNDRELAFIENHYKEMTNEEMASKLNRTVSSVQLKVHQLSLKGPNGRKPRRRDTYKGERLKKGQSIGMLTIKEVLDTPQETTCICECSCSPGTYFERTSHDLKSRTNHSCGCQALQKAKNRFTTHGQTKSKFYSNWKSMKDRCYNPNHESYHNYGGRGIVVCDEWKSFKEYLKWAEKYYIEGTTVHRIDNDLGYNPDNCTWATPKEHANARRNNRLLTLFGETKTVTQWSEDPRSLVGEMTIRYRIDNGWDDEESVLTPAGITPNRTGRPIRINKLEVYGNLTVLSIEYRTRGNQQAVWCECKCRCGNKTGKWGSYIKQQVKKGSIPSCGCIRSENARNRITQYNQR